MSKPTTVPEPPLGSKMPHSMRMVVDLPAPFGPSTPKISPRRTCNDTSFTATSEPKRRDSERVSMMISGSLTSLASRQLHEGRHARAQLLFRVIDAHAHAHDQGFSLFFTEQVTRRKFGTARDVLDVAKKLGAQGVDLDMRRFAHENPRNCGLGDEHVD